jgi:hypothetical protein
VDSDRREEGKTPINLNSVDIVKGGGGKQGRRGWE